MNNTLIASIAFSLFILCPRMAGMTYVIAKSSHVNIVQSVIFGMVLAIPLTILMVHIFGKYGLWGALAFCIITDLGAALIMTKMSLKAALETFVIALFVIVGVRVASFVSKFIF
ncbi:MAG TPA: hypothetical protein EYP21_07745 [Syntrophaceae bacterium]|nr:hypothetical protein [Syntrophaceae bacterium]